jgi:hypothetical protein
VTSKSKKKAVRGKNLLPETIHSILSPGVTWNSPDTGKRALRTAESSPAEGRKRRKSKNITRGVKARTRAWKERKRLKWKKETGKGIVGSQD